MSLAELQQIVVGALTGLGASTVFVLVLVPTRNVVLAVSSGSGALAVAVAATLAVGVAGSALWKVVHTTKGYAWWMIAGVLIGGLAAALR